MKHKRELEEAIRRKRSAVLIVNVHSRKGRHLFLKARNLLEMAGLDLIASHPVKNVEDAAQIVGDAIDQGCELIIVGGGDGTLNAVAEHFAYRDAVLGILPLGTANNFARAIGIPPSLEEAVDIISRGKVVDVDLARVNQHYFANIATIGFPADLVRYTSPRLKRYLGIVAYAVSFFLQLLRQKRFICTIKAGDRIHTVRTYQVIIANGSYYGIRKLTPTVSVDDRSILISTMESMSRWQVIFFWLGYFLGVHRRTPEIYYIKAGEAEIATDPEKHVYIDGNILVKTPVQISVVPNALRVLAPQSFQDDLA
jgi:diacylglycerol kinase (ATP)